ncbi:MAG: hypothetical protein ABIO95_00860 [Bdellovibrionota bacterium]
MNNILGVLPTYTVGLFDDGFCTNRLGMGPVADFRSGGSGVQIDVIPNATTPVYGQSFDQAGNQSSCVLLGSFLHNTLPPSRPNFVSISPGTPSYTRRVLLRGSLSASSSPMPPVAVDIYSNSTCSSLLTTTTPSQFTGAGISFLVPRNLTSAMSAQSRDSLGNLSACQLMRNFAHSDTGPQGFAVTSLNNGSVSLAWIPDTVASPSPSYSIERSRKTGGPYTIIAKDLLSPFYVDSNVRGGETYYYVVRASNTTGTSFPSVESSLTIAAAAPDVPYAINATPGDTRVTLTWSASGLAIDFRVLRSNKAGGPYTVIVDTLKSQSYIDDTVTNGQPYYYVVQARNPTGMSAYSGEASAVPRSQALAPTGVVATGITSSPACNGNRGVEIRWTSSPYFNEFMIRRGTSPSNGYEIGRSFGDSYIDCETSNDMNTLRYYSVSAMWSGAEGIASTQSEFYAGTAPTIYANPGDAVIDVGWNNPDNAPNYNVYRALAGTTGYTLYTTLSGSSLLDSLVTNGTAYSYFVEPVFGSGALGWRSGSVSATPTTFPSAPSNLSLVVVNGDQAQLQWSPSPRYNAFNIYRGSSAGSLSYYGNTTTPSFTDTNPSSGMNYYQVTSAWGNSETAASNTVSYRSSRVSGVTATIASSTITISWTALSATGLTGYKVLRGTSSGGSYTTISTQSALSYIDNATTSGVAYFYVVVPTFSDATQGVNSIEVAASRGSSVPAGLSITATTGTSVTLQWAKVLNSSLYTIYSAASASGPWTQRTQVVSTSGNVTALTANTIVYFSVTAKVSNIESAKSTAVSGRIVDSPGIPLVIAKNAAVDLSWAPATGALTYQLQRSTDAINFTNIASAQAATTFTDSTVTNQTYYYYRVLATFTSETRLSGLSSGVMPGFVPDVPRGLSANGNGGGTDIYLSWAGVNRTSGYNIYSSTSAGGPFTIWASTSSSNNNQVSSLTSNQTYYFRVTSLNGTNESAQSASLAVVPSIMPPSPAVQINASSAAVLTWSSVSTASTYDVIRSSDAVNYITVASGIGATTYTDSTLVSNVAYVYRYVPKNAAGVEMATSSYSTPVSAGAKPLSPVELSARSAAANQVLLSWVPVSNVVSYKIYRSTVSGSGYTLQGILSVPSNAYTDASAVNGSTYYYIATSVNSSGVESDPSNEAGVRLIAGPASLLATATNGSTNLSWSASASATNYRVLRSTISGGPYASLASANATTSFSDTQIENGTTYYYVVVANYASGAVSQDSAQASAVGINGMNLLVPIELVDAPLTSDVTDTTFERSRTSFEPAAYDGTVTTRFEIVAINLDSSARDVDLVDSTGAVVATISLPAGLNLMKRLSSAFISNSFNDTYRIRIHATPASDGLVQVGAARIMVTQVGATMTKIYYPLSSSNQSPSRFDLIAPLYTTTSSSSADFSGASYYVRNTASLSELDSWLPWELETLVAQSGNAEGTVSLYNINKSLDVGDTGANIPSGGSISMINSPFIDGVSNFGSGEEGNNFRIALRCTWACDEGDVSLYKAGLWVRLVRLKKAEVLIRTSFGSQMMSGVTSLASNRAKIDTSVFSNPIVLFQALVSSTGTTTLDLMDEGTRDDSSGSSSAVSGSSVTTNSSTKALQRSPTFTVVSGDRHTVRATSSASSTLTESAIVIRANR